MTSSWPLRTLRCAFSGCNQLPSTLDEQWWAVISGFCSDLRARLAWCRLPWIAGSQRSICSGETLVMSQGYFRRGLRRNKDMLCSLVQMDLTGTCPSSHHPSTHTDTSRAWLWAVGVSGENIPAALTANLHTTWPIDETWPNLNTFLTNRYSNLTGNRDFHVQHDTCIYTRIAMCI